MTEQPPYQTVTRITRPTDRSRWVAWPMVCAVSVIVAGCGADRLTQAEALLDVLALEDARPLGAQGVQALVGRTTSEDPDTRRFAVRALGRLEDPTLLHRLTPLLSDEDPSVRASAAWAVAQAVHGADGAEAVAPLLRAAGAETVPVARGELARSLGRVRPEEGDSRAVVGLLAEWAADPELPVEVALGVALGLEGLTRFPGPAASDDGLYGALESLATRPARAAGAEGRVRAVALLALGQRGRLTDTQVGSALQDPDPDVRSVGARFLATVDGPERESLVAIALADEAPQVRVEAMRVTSTGERSAGRCQWLLAAAVSQDPSAARLVAIDALSSPCPEPMGSAVLDVLDSLAAELPEEGSGWHPATHALNALARTAPQRATIHLDIHVRHESPFVRAQAAGTAAVLGDATALRALADDPDPNVRTAAFPALVELEGLPATTPLLVDALGSDDGQLLLTVAGLLTGTDHADAGTAAIEAFERISRARRQTARDPRMALLELLSESGGVELAPGLQPYLEDYDPLVATRVAALLTIWTGEPTEARPQPPERLPLPSAQDVADMAARRVALHMASGGTITVELLPYLAPTNAYRFFRLASEGHFDGLTFHRVVPAFVIQGGSPAANEYAGDGPFTRDEIGRISHWRGTVGLSTRGRDTGDGQIFVNLVHNIRLDHDYTIFGRVVSGMEYVDRVRAGDVIQSVEILR